MAWKPIIRFSVAFFSIFLTALTVCGADSVASRLAEATVRLTVPNNGNAQASGTIVSREQDHALVITCAHVFRGTAVGTPVQVTTFSSMTPSHHAGQLLDCDNSTDVAVVAVFDAPPVTPIPLAQATEVSTVGESVFVAGCDAGRAPRVQATLVTAIGRFPGRPNLAVDAMPVLGRSGGGLVTSDGRLVGVCNGINPCEKEGIYAGISAVHAQLGKISSR